jgi:hypothetical protein
MRLIVPPPCDSNNYLPGKGLPAGGTAMLTSGATKGLADRQSRSAPVRKQRTIMERRVPTLSQPAQRHRVGRSRHDSRISGRRPTLDVHAVLPDETRIAV